MLCKYQEPSKWFELVKLFLAFFLTAIIGNQVTERYKEKEAAQAQHVIIVEHATTVFYDIIDTCAKRHYYALRYFGSISQNMPPAEQEARWKSYDNMVIYWNENRLRNLALINRYYGDDSVRYFYYNIFPLINSIHLALNDYHNTKEKFDVKLMQKNLDQLDNVITDFSDSLQLKLKNNDKMR